MKNFFKNNLSVLVFSLILLVIFIFGGIFSRYMTKQISVHEFDSSLLELAGTGQKVVIFETEQLEKEYLLPTSETATYQPELVSAYKILEDKEEVVVVYIISTQGRDEGLEIAYAIDIATATLIDVLVMANNETPSYFDELNNLFFRQLRDKDFDDPVFTIDSVAGSTLSSEAFETGMKYARELFARDFDFVIPNLPYEITSIVRNFDDTTFIAKPFIVNLTYGPENKSLEAYFDSEFNLVEVIDGETPDQVYLDLFASVIPQTDFVDTETVIEAYDSDTKKLTIETIAYGGQVITVEFELNAALDAVVDMTVTSSQSYDQSFEYSGGNPPAIENAYKDQYLIDGTVIDSFAGATITSNAMARILILANEVLNAWGGN